VGGEGLARTSTLGLLTLSYRATRTMRGLMEEVLPGSASSLHTSRGVRAQGIHRFKKESQLHLNLAEHRMPPWPWLL
jgi:hypothetical protein